MTTKEAAPAMPAEQAADLAALESGAMEGQAAQVAETGGQDGPPRQTLDAEIAGLVSMVVAALSPALPSLRAIYTPEATAVASSAVAAVCQKHGWLSDGVFGEWGEEIAAAAVLVPLGIATYQGVKGDISRAKAAHEAAGREPRQVEARGPAEAPGQGSRDVTFGGVVAEGGA